MPRVKLKIIWIARFWTDSRCWACVRLMRWCQSGAAYSRTGRITVNVYYVFSYLYHFCIRFLMLYAEIIGPVQLWRWPGLGLRWQALALWSEALALELGICGLVNIPASHLFRTSLSLSPVYRPFFPGEPGLTGTGTSPFCIYWS